LILVSVEMLAKAKCYTQTDKITGAADGMKTEILAKGKVKVKLSL
jgi:hypothetical protein